MFRTTLVSWLRLGQISCKVPATSCRINQCLIAFTASNRFHSQPVLYTLDKEVRHKSQIISSAQERKEEHIDSSNIDVSGLTEAGVTIPTLETHAQLVDGVRYDELPIVHIHASINNTIIKVTDFTGTKFIAQNSCGMEGFKNIKKSTTVAAQATGQTIGTKTLKKGIKNVRVVVKGLGVGRLSSLKGLQLAGLNIVSISDRTHMPHAGPRPRKAKRL